MKQSLLLYLLLICAYTTQAQGTLRVKAGDDIAKAYSPNGFYRFPQFLESAFIMKDGQTAKTKANYNILTGAVQYINQRGDTLELTQPERVALVTIGTAHFVFDKFFIEIISNNDSLKLARRTFIRLHMEKKGGYGEAAPAASIDNYTNLLTSASAYSLRLNQEVVITTLNSYFWLDYENHSAPATKRNIDRLITSAGKPKVEAYIDQNNISFSKEDQLLQLAQFAAAYAKTGK